MKNLELLLISLEYIENHLCDDMKTDVIAAACSCSKSTLEKLFRCTYHIPVHDYVIRRRMMKAAKRLIECPEMNILDVALEYGYGTHESFARAFKQVWNCKPSEFRNSKYTELFPRFQVPRRTGDAYIMERRPVDITELYDLFTERKDCYFVCCDIEQMIKINRISHKAGDLAIIESLKRMNDAASENDMVFRIGGDEFCILTDSNTIDYAKELAAKILALNGKTFLFEGQEIPLTLWAFVTRPEQKTIRYNELFGELHTAIRDGKEVSL